MADSGVVTQLLIRWSGGDPSAANELIPVVYDELRRLAAGHLRRENPDHSIQTTALVHEAYLRLVDAPRVSMESRSQFFGLASKVMRNVLVDAARRRNTAKRRGEQQRVSVSQAEGVAMGENLDFVALDDALTELSNDWPRHSRIVELRFFGGLTIEETAEVLDISHATVEREWNFARALLRRKLNG